MSNYRRRLIIGSTYDSDADIVDFVHRRKVYLKNREKAKLLVASSRRLYI